MNKQTISKSVSIQAPGEQVWNVLTDDDMTRRWYSAFSEGTHAETDWKEGSKVVFTDGSHDGLIGKIVTSAPNRLLSVEYTGVLSKGTEDYESELARAVQGGKETYRLVQEGGHTNLYIECDMSEEMFEPMNRLWDEAVKRIKSLSENN
jgi:uncharacterized protein YndB with AHSA1/START domain